MALSASLRSAPLVRALKRPTIRTDRADLSPAARSFLLMSVKLLNIAAKHPANTRRTVSRTRVCVTRVKSRRAFDQGRTYKRPAVTELRPDPKEGCYHRESVMITMPGLLTADSDETCPPTVTRAFIIERRDDGKSRPHCGVRI